MEMSSLVWFIVKLEKEVAYTPISLPEKSHGPRSLVDCSPWGHRELGMTEQLTHT